MAGDWVPVTKGLAKKREVIYIAAITKRSRHEVMGLLCDFWLWADEETIDGILPQMVLDQMPSIIGADADFWLAVVQAGWLVVTKDGLQVPNFKRWLGNSAKQRMLKNRRQERWRAGKEDVDVLVDVDAPTREEKRREEKRTASAVPSADEPPEEDTKSRTKKARPQDDLFNAICEVTASDPQASGSWVGRVCKCLRSADPPYTPQEVRLLGEIWEKRGYDLPMTLTSVERNIGWTRDKPRISNSGENGRRGKSAAEKVAEIARKQAEGKT